MDNVIDLSAAYNHTQFELNNLFLLLKNLQNQPSPLRNSNSRLRLCLKLCHVAE